MPPGECERSGSPAGPDGPCLPLRVLPSALLPSELVLKQSEYLGNRLFHAEFTRIQTQLRTLGNLIGIVDPGEVLNFPAPSARIQPFHIAPLAFLQRRCHIDLHKPGAQPPNEIPRLPVG